MHRDKPAAEKFMPTQPRQKVLEKPNRGSIL
jgi:hypothetical protein